VRRRPTRSPRAARTRRETTTRRPPSAPVS
jgi:hypothetical protein